MPKGHTFTCHLQIEQPSCSTVQNRPTHETHLQQGLKNPEYKGTQQDLTEEKLRKLRNAGLGIQGKALTRIKVLLRKSFLTRFFLSTFKISSRSYMNLPWSVLRSWTSYQTHSQNLLKFHLLLRWWTVSWVSITKEQRRFKPIITQLGILNHTTYAGPWTTYINLPSDPLNKNRSAPPKNTVHHQSSPLPRGYTLFPPSLHSQCAISHSHDRITKLRLTGVCVSVFRTNTSE